jgi:hypothetical protein
LFSSARRIAAPTVTTHDGSQIDTPEPFFQVRRFDAVRGQCQGFPVRLRGFRVAPQTPQEIRARRVVEAVALQIAGLPDRLDEPQALGEAAAHRDRDGVVQRHDRRGRVLEENRVERLDLAPVGLGRGLRARMEGADRGLELVRTRRTEREGGVEAREAFRDLAGLPERAVLLLERNELAADGDARVATRVRA